ncbi:putative clathrin assembly protein At2g25430 [Mangifera indica]|uniref:putative clathrin assembly protein At2g25430 n=1 Tax=Mangifera indica TaxID=29780 RepID=UPI001CF9D925|nr:putative clathrin assembly protein At2g25430 [Mangifera indica]
MHRRLRQLFTRVKEHSSVSYAKIATAGGFCDVELIIVKATAPDDLPFSDKYVLELLKIFSISSLSLRAFSVSFSRRFAKTRSWRVALKCLILLHRLLRSLPESSPFRTELLWSRTNGYLFLNPCYFQDESSSTPEDYTEFIRSYANLLDEALDCFALDGGASETPEREGQSLSNKMKEVGRMIEVLTQLQSLIDRVMECRPSGVAARSFIVEIAMKFIIRDSFICYRTFRREIVLVLDNLFQMPYRSCIVAFGIYKKAALQANQLCEFYDWFKGMGICGAYEYPFVDRIPQIQIQALEAFLHEMWQLTESSSSSSSSTLTPQLTEDEGDKQIAVSKAIDVSTQWEKFEDEGVRRGGEIVPMIRFEESENDSWEDLLDASVNFPCVGSNLLNKDGCEKEERNRGDYTSDWKIQVYNPWAASSFNQPYRMPYQPGLYLNLPMAMYQ